MKCLVFILPVANPERQCYLKNLPGVVNCNPDGASTETPKKFDFRILPGFGTTNLLLIKMINQYRKSCDN
jgi:hypothetical protein